MTWTLYVEAVGSLLLPAFAFVTRRGGPMVGLLLLAGVVALAMPAQWGQPTSYLLCFQVGVLIACFPVRPRASSALLLAFGGVLFLLERLMFPAGFASTAINTVASALVLTAILKGDQSSAWLESPVLRFLGRISYGIYLFHLPAAYVVLWAATATGVLTLPGLLPHLVLATAILALTTAVAWWAYAAVEAPAIALGRRLARDWRSRVHATVEDAGPAS